MNPQSQASDVSAPNAALVNGIAPGYRPTPGNGLVLKLGPGASFQADGTVADYSGGQLTMADWSTNYVFLDADAACIPASSTSAFSPTDMPIAIVVTAAGVITRITDLRCTPATPASGARGPAGNNGTNGATWYSGAGAPGSGLGALGDYYFRTATGHVYRKTAGDAWTDIADLTGPVGASVWLQNTGPPGSEIGSVGDFYFNASNGDIYTKTGDGWGAAIANLVGPVGPASTFLAATLDITSVQLLLMGTD